MIRLNLHFVIAGVCLLLASPALTQESLSLQQSGYFLPEGEEFHADALYGMALASFENEVISYPTVKGLAKSSFALDESRSIDLMLESISRSTSAYDINNLYVSIGDKYFRQKDYKAARKYFLLTDENYMTDDQSEELNFRLGYSYLLDKSFMEAETYFRKSALFRGEFLVDNKYYMGICQYFLNKQENAIENFKAVDAHSKYRGLVPYYLAQIYFKNEDYRQAIDYAENRLNTPGLRNKNEIQKIIGLSYLALKDYDKALYHLDAYAMASPKLTENEFYQIGMAHYNLSQYDKAITFFGELSHQNSAIGQVSNYLSGSIFLQGGDKKKAQSAYKQASKFDFFPDIKSESNFLYYKLSADMGEERIAINGLSAIREGESHYFEAQNLLAQILLRSKDYVAAITAIEKLESPSKPIMLSYKNISYDYGVQQLKDGHHDNAIRHLKTSSMIKADAGDIGDKVNYWLGYAEDQKGNRDESRKYLNAYLNTNDKSYDFKSRYLMAYQDLEAKNYESAKSNLEYALGTVDENNAETTLINDAIIRLADLELLDNNYTAAITYYDLAINNGADESDYILYQKALIYGVNNDQLNKLTSLEALLKNYPQSKYKDDALFELGESLLALNKNNDAVKVYQSILAEYKDQSPYSATSYLRLGLISYNQGDLKSAVEYYKKGIKLGTDKDEERQAMLAIEEIYVRDLNDPESYFEFAEKQGKEIKDISKDSISYHVAFNSYKAGQYYEAIQLFNNYIDLYKSGYYKEDALYYSGESAVLVKDYDLALSSYEQIISDQMQKYYMPAIEKAALIAYNHKQDFNKSFDLYDLLISIESDQSVNIYEAALYCAYKIQNEEGILNYATYLSTNEKASNETKGTAFYYLGKSMERKKEWDKAISHYQNVIKLTTSNKAAEGSYRISQIHYNQDRLAQAEVSAFETTKVAAKYPYWVAKSLILLGDIYTKNEDYLNASAAFESVIENFKDSQEIIQEAQAKLGNLNTLIESNSRIKEEDALELIQNDSIK